MDAWQQGWTITPENHICIKMPYKSASSFITMYVSTALADAIVWQPAVSNIKISNTQWQGSEDIGDADTLLITTQQMGTVNSTATVTIQDQDGNHMNINPPSYGVSLASGATDTTSVQILNTGATSKETGNLLITVTDELGKVTDTKLVSYTLEPKGVGATSLTVYTVDAVTQKKVNGIQVAISYGTTNLPIQVTGADGSFTISLEGVQGSVSVTSVETTQYNSASSTKQVSVGANTLFLQLTPKGKGGIPWWQQYLWLIILTVLIAVVVAVAAVIVTQQKKARYRR
jgi:hypothetical protein